MVAPQSSTAAESDTPPPAARQTPPDHHPHFPAPPANSSPADKTLQQNIHRVLADPTPSASGNVPLARPYTYRIYRTHNQSPQPRACRPTFSPWRRPPIPPRLQTHAP